MALYENVVANVVLAYSKNEMMEIMNHLYECCYHYNSQ